MLVKIINYKESVAMRYNINDRGENMRIGVDIDNVLSNFNEVLLNDYINHDKSLRNNGIVNKEVYIRNMFDWSDITGGNSGQPFVTGTIGSIQVVAE